MSIETRAGLVPMGGRLVVAAGLATAAAVHFRLAVGYLDEPALVGVVAAVFACTGLAGAIVLVAVGRPGLLLGAAAVSAVGMAGYLVPRLVPVAGLEGQLGDWLDPWPFAAFLLDALTVRLAVFVLRRASRLGH